MPRRCWRASDRVSGEHGRVAAPCPSSGLLHCACQSCARHQISIRMTNTPDFVRFTICGIPELGSHYESGVTHVLSILDPEWPEPPEFEEYAPHRRIGLRFHDIIDPLPGRCAPTRNDVAPLLAFGHELRDAETCHLLVHCHAGISRSTAATALILAQAHPTRPAGDVFDAVSRIRPR